MYTGTEGVYRGERECVQMGEGHVQREYVQREFTEGQRVCIEGKGSL